MLASTCSIRRLTALGVKFRSRVFTALKRLPSTATTPPNAELAAEHHEVTPSHHLKSPAGWLRDIMAWLGGFPARVRGSAKWAAWFDGQKALRRP